MPQRAPLIGNLKSKFVEVVAGRNLVCGLKEGGNSLCWSTWPDDQYGYTSVYQDTDVIHLSSYSTGVFPAICGLKMGGSPICWETNRTDGRIQPFQPGMEVLRDRASQLERSQVLGDSTSQLQPHALKTKGPKARPRAIEK